MVEQQLCWMIILWMSCIIILEDSRYLPRNTEVILDIIMDETEDFFEDEKTKEEVIAIIQSRVQLYLDEIK